MSGRNILKFILMLCLPGILEAQVALHGLFTPVMLQPDTTVIYLRDYLPDLDYSEISCPEGLINHRPESDTLVLTGRLSQKMATIDLATPRGTESLLLINHNLKQAAINIPEGQVEGQDVRIFGSFNNWNREVAPTLPEKGFYLKTLRLPPGRYEYKLLVDGLEMTDPSNMETISNGMGSFNSVLRIEDDHPPFPANFELRRQPDNDVEIRIADGANEYLAFWNNRLIPVFYNHDESGNCRLRIPAEAQTIKRSYIRIYSYLGQHRGKDMLVPLDSGQVVSSVEQLDRSDWHQARMYFLMVDRFNNANKENDLPTPDPEIQPQANYMGGDLEGIDEKVRENFFDSLGVNTIWLSYYPGTT